jgi:glycosyltransferase involved in cell wall biosynthesis
VTTQISTILRQSLNIKTPNILTTVTHSGYETNLAKSDAVFYSLSGFTGINGGWDYHNRPCPDNYHVLGKTESLPLWLDLDIVLAQQRWGSYQILIHVARNLNLPLIALEHTLPNPNSTQAQFEEYHAMLGDVNVFISEFSRDAWGFTPNNSIVIRHGVDTNTFTPSDKIREPFILSVVNDWKNRDWCQPAGQKILTTNGYVPIEKIVKGHTVLTDSGLPYKVIQTFRRMYNGPMVTITLDNNHKLSFTAEHGIRVYRDNQEKYIDSSRLRSGDKTKFPKIQQTNFTFNDEELSWLIGMIVSDGSISDNGNISIVYKLDDVETANKAKTLLQNIIGYSSISNRHRKNGKNVITVESTSKIFGNWLKYAIGGKSYNKKLPHFIMESSDKIKLKALQGLWFGDGSFKNGANHQPRACYSTISIELASQVSSLLHSFGVKNSISFQKRTTNKSNGKIVPIYRIICSGKENVQNCQNLIDKEIILNPYSYTITNVDINYEWSGEVFNCEVETDPSYVVYPGIVSHNCCGHKIWERVTQGLPVYPVGDTKGLSVPARDIDELVNFYQRARIFINTSTVSPVPSALLEAMSCGCACVSTATCMIPEFIIDGYNGFITNDEEQMRERLILLLNNPKLAEQIGKNARKTIENEFSIERFANDWTTLFKKVLR